MALFEYVAEEIAQDHAEGLISRRDAIRTLVLMGFTATTAGALLAGPAGAATKTTKKKAPATTKAKAKAPVTTTTPAPTTPATTTPATTTAAAARVPEAIRFPGPAGELQATFLAPTQPRGAVLIIHENRGLTDHFRAMPARFAADGYAALALDLASRQGGTAAVADQMPAPLTSTPTADLVADMKAALSELEKRVPGKKLGVIGFCFGGGMVWNLLASGEPRVSAATPFYGTPPDPADFSGSKNAAVLAIYAGLDARVNGTRDAATKAMEAAGLVHEVRTFPGVDHAFFNDTGPRYDATQAAAAYKAVLAWYGKYLG